MLIACTNHAAIVIKGDDEAASGQSFSFRVQKYNQSNAPTLFGVNLYVASHPDDGGADMVKEYAVSRVTRDTNSFLPLTPQQAKVNGSQEAIANPLYDQGIVAMTLFNGIDSILSGANERPVVVTSADPKTIYYINQFNTTASNVEILSPYNAGEFKQNTPDSSGATTAGVVALASAAPYTFAAVRPAAGLFGATGSGIAFIKLGQISNDTISFTGPIVVDAESGSLGRSGGNRALAINTTIDQLKIGSDLASIETIVDLHWDAKVQRLYVALQVTGGAAGSDGARAILVGRVKDESLLEFYAIAPTAVFDGAQDKIVGALGANAVVTINKVRSMFTSTALSYLIVQGGVGNAAAVSRSVYALPLVNGNTSDADVVLNGTIANKNAEPEDIFTSTTIPIFGKRVVKTAATTAAQMPLATDSAVLVGGGQLPDGEITDMYVYGDAVYVTVQSSDANEQPGVFQSRAIFEKNGKIKAWTSWQRASGLLDKTQSTVLDPVTAQWYTLVADSSNAVKTVKRTEWAGGDEDGFASAATIAQETFAQADGGIQGLNNFVVTSTTYGTSTPGLLDISALVATGKDTVMLIQTSHVISGGVIPTTGANFGPETLFTNGTITQNLPNGSSKIVSISGGILEDIGPLTVAEVARDGSSGSKCYLFVGGSNGVAILSAADGSGWDPIGGLSDGFSGLAAGMSFKKIGNYTNVKKLINDDQYLYILTDQTLDRINITTNAVGLGSISPTTIATPASIPGLTATGSFLDALISEKLLILATSKGLLRIGNGLDVRTVDAAGVSWQRIDAPETVGPIQQLIAITTSHRAQNFARDTNGSNVIALSGYRGKNQSQIVRYSISPTTSSGVVDTTIEQINDLYVEDIPSYFASFGSFRNLAGSDGALYFGAVSKREDTDPLVTTFFADGGVQTGSHFLMNKLLPIDFSGSDLITALLRNSATGSWLSAGDTGIKANE